MAKFMISYDLVKRKDYPKLWDELDRIGAHKALDSLYLLAINNTAVEVRDHLQAFIDDDDRLMVIEFTKKPTYNRALKGTNAWIDANF